MGLFLAEFFFDVLDQEAREFFGSRPRLSRHVHFNEAVKHPFTQR